MAKKIEIAYSIMLLEGKYHQKMSYIHVVLDDWSKIDKEQFFSNYCTMINALNKIKEIDLKLGKFILTNNFDETYEEIEEISKKLKK